MKEFIKDKNLVPEEALNTLLHGFGFFLSIIGLLFLIIMAFIYGETIHIVSSLIYGTTLVMVYLSSTLLHGSLSLRKNSLLLEKLDHCAIYLLIAGTYTPFTLVTLQGGLGWSIFGIVWTIAVLGVIYKAIYLNRFPMMENVSYLIMGWICISAVSPLIEKLGFSGFFWLLAGGLFYTIGVPFFVLDKKHRFNHAIWHILVLGGSICHFIAIANYVLPFNS